MSGSCINWAICKSAPRSRQTTTPALHHSVFYRPDALPVAQPTASKHWRKVLKWVGKSAGNSGSWGDSGRCQDWYTLRELEGGRFHKLHRWNSETCLPNKWSNLFYSAVKRQLIFLKIFLLADRHYCLQQVLWSLVLCLGFKVPQHHFWVVLVLILEALVGTHTHTHPFNGRFSRTTRVSRYQKGKTSLDVTEARDSEWQWHQLGHKQVCTSLQTDNPTIQFFTGQMLFLLPNQQRRSTGR